MNNIIKYSRYTFISFFLIIFFIPTFFIPILYSDFENNNSILNSYINFNGKYFWPIPGYTSITSYFGKRVSPTAGASNFHKGIDIGAPEGTNLYAISDGKITFLNFLGRWRLYLNFRM